MALDFYAGCLGGCAGVFVGHPFDTVKVRLQTQDVSRQLYKGTFHCLSTIIKNESIMGLFKGMSSPMAGLAAINAVVFGTYGNLMRASPFPNSLSSNFIAGSTAGLVQSLICSPMELVKTRIQLQGQTQVKTQIPHWRKPVHKYRNPLDCLRTVFRQEGLRGVYRGLGCTILRDSPGFGVYFATYEYLTQKVTNAYGNVSTIALLATGGLAGVWSWIVVYPFDVIKSRLQVDGMDGTKKYNGFYDCVIKSYENEGLRVFTKGLNSTVIRAFPTNAATFAVFTWVFMIWDNPSDTSEKSTKQSNASLMEKKLHKITTACVDSCA